MSRPPPTSAFYRRQTHRKRSIRRLIFKDASTSVYHLLKDIVTVIMVNGWTHTHNAM
jgi:hypothetical protein